MKPYKRYRKSIRLQCYDYSSPGYYFVTICTRNRESIFGEVEDGKMVLNELGKIANKYWLRMPINFDYIRIRAYVVMPNHVHGIIQITKKHNPAVGAIHELPLRLGYMDHESYRKRRRLMYLPKIIGWYKMNVTREINQNYKLDSSSCWQRNYHEHVIRDQESLNKITEYIDMNPRLWNEDRYFR